MIFLFTFLSFSKQIAGLEKKFYSMEWPAYQDKRVEGPNNSVSWTGKKLGPNMLQTADWYKKKIERLLISKAIFDCWVKQTFSEILNKIERVLFEKIEKECQLFVYKKCSINNFFLFLIRFWRKFVRL